MSRAPALRQKSCENGREKFWQRMEIHTYTHSYMVAAVKRLQPPFRHNSPRNSSGCPIVQCSSSAVSRTSKTVFDQSKRSKFGGKLVPLLFAIDSYEVSEAAGIGRCGCCSALVSGAMKGSGGPKLSLEGTLELAARPNNIRRDEVAYTFQGMYDLKFQASFALIWPRASRHARRYGTKIVTFLL